MRDVLVIGGGYAGLAAVRALSATLPAEWGLTLLDRSDAHALLTRLPEVVSGRVRPAFARVPFGLVLPARVRFTRTEALGIDPERRVVVTRQGDFPWDALVLAVGVEPQNAGDTDAPLCLPLRSVDHAVTLRDTVRGALAERKRASIVIIGAGYTGSEVAGELLWSGTPPPRITLLADLPRLLPQGNPRLAAVADRVLRDRGADIHLGVRIECVTHGAVRLRDSRVFAADIVIWAGQASVDPRWARILPTAEAGRIQVGATLETHIPGLYVVGDAAFIGDTPANAQLAIQQGRLAAGNLLRTIKGEPQREFRARMAGEALSLGPRDGVAEVLGVVVTGRRALAVKSAALARYLTSLGGPLLARRYTLQGGTGARR